jgi:Rieske Fe-S protein
VRWQEKREEFLCPCHGGLYDVYGSVMGGPPPRDLPRFETRVDKELLYIKNPAKGWPG